MKNNEMIIEVLNDLIKINNDRIAGYENAAGGVDPSEVMLKTLFYQLAEESQDFKSDLSAWAVALGDEPASNSAAPGRIYRAWMDRKATFSGDNNKSTLESCEFGEDAFQKAFEMVLAAREDLSADIRHTIEEQKNIAKMSHDLIRNQRDEYSAVAPNLS